MNQEDLGSQNSIQVSQPLSVANGSSQLGRSTPVNLTFVDSAVDDIDTLISQVERGTQVVVLDSTSDGISQITEVLEQYDNVASLNIVSHGQAGELQLGSSTIDSGDLASYSDEFRRWRTALTSDADILFYGCNVAAGQDGANFLNQLSRMTGADIAGSTDLTGGSDLGGDWDLEFSTGSIEAESPFRSSVGEAYDAVLDGGRTVFSSNDSRGLQDYRLDTNTRHGVTQANNPAGSGQVLRFDLRRNDPISNNRHRAEVVPRIDDVNFNQNYTYSFRTFFPGDFVRDRSSEIVAQFHGRPDRNLGENFRRPPLALSVRDGRFELLQNYDSDRVTNTRQQGGFTERRTTLGEVQHGRWIDWRVEVNWSHRGNGVLRVYQNDRLVLNHQGANTYNDARPPFAKLGIYKFDWTVRPQNSSTNRRVFFADDYQLTEGFTGGGTSQNSRPIAAQSVEDSPIQATPISNNLGGGSNSSQNRNNSRSSSNAIRIEAESLQLNGYRTERVSTASGGKLIGLRGRGRNERGSATYVHRGSNGTFDLDLSYFDERDGEGRIQVQLNGRTIERFTLDDRSGTPDANGRSRRTRTLDGLRLRAGDRLTIVGQEQNFEPVRLDYLELNPVSGQASSSNATLAGNGNNSNARAGNSGSNSFDRTLQAENARLIGGANIARINSAQGNRVARFQQSASNAIEWTINVPESGRYNLQYLYSQGANVSRSPISVSINGRRPGSPPPFRSTGGSNNFQFAGDEVFLERGRNTIRLQATGRTRASFDSLRVRAV